jgi:antitoxin ParD1/3/4
MATMTISLPGPMKEWIEAQIRESDYASTSDYVRDLIRRDKYRREHERPLTLEELHRKLVESEASGVSDRTVAEIFEQAKSFVSSRERSGG